MLVEPAGGSPRPKAHRVAAQPADTVYFSLIAPNYQPLTHGAPFAAGAVVDAASAAGGWLVVLENLYLYGPTGYLYGPTGGAPMTESTPIHPTSAKTAVQHECPHSSSNRTLPAA